MRDHRKLKAFMLADELVSEVYRLTRHFPEDERYGLTSQMRRGAVSIVANIVEGNARLSRCEYRHFLSISFGSARELEYLIRLSRRFGYLSAFQEKDLANRASYVAALLTGLIRRYSQSE